MNKKELIVGIHRNVFSTIGALRATTPFTVTDFEKFVDATCNFITIASRNMLDGFKKDTHQVLGKSASLKGDTLSIVINEAGQTITANDKLMDVYHELKTGVQTIKQILPTIVFYKDENGVRTYFAYRRTQQVGENRLAGKAAIAWGGHVDFDPQMCTVIDGKEQFEYNTAKGISSTLIREVIEELGFSFHDAQVIVDKVTLDNSDANIGVINDDSDEVGKLHVGLVFLINANDKVEDPVSEELARMQSISSIIEKCTIETELALIGWVTKEELYELDPESWAKIIVENSHKLRVIE